MFIYVVEKLKKVLKYKRKKAFKFNDLIAFLKKTQKEKTDHANEEQQALIQSLAPVIKSRISRLVSFRVEKMINTIERQHFKVDKIMQVLEAVHSAITLKI